MIGLLNYQHVPLPKCCETEDQRSELPESTPLQKRGTLTKTKDMEIQDLCVDICTLPETNKSHLRFDGWKTSLSN